MTGRYQYRLARRRREFTAWECSRCGRRESTPLPAVDVSHRCRDGSVYWLKGVTA